jgi:hypothetical protein
MWIFDSQVEPAQLYCFRLNTCICARDSGEVEWNR